MHQLCYSRDITIEQIVAIQPNDPALSSFDEMGMTPLHVLCYNPCAGKDMIPTLVSRCPPSVISARNRSDMRPVELYLKANVFSDEDIDKITSLFLTSVQFIEFLK